jgi:2'-5' RNA ligase
VRVGEIEKVAGDHTPTQPPKFPSQLRHCSKTCKVEQLLLSRRPDPQQSATSVVIGPPSFLIYNQRVKIYKITSYFNLVSRPDWLITFEESFKNSASQYHITYKFPTFISEKNVSNAMDLIKAISINAKPFHLSFNTIKIDNAYSGNVILLTDKENKQVVEFQKKLISSLRDFGKNIHEEGQRFEEGFVPHLTLARKLDDTDLQKAISCIPNNPNLEALVTNATFTLANEWKSDSLKEETIFNLEG